MELSDSCTISFDPKNSVSESKIIISNPKIIRRMTYIQFNGIVHLDEYIGRYFIRKSKCAISLSKRKIETLVFKNHYNNGDLDEYIHTFVFTDCNTNMDVEYTLTCNTVTDYDGTLSRLRCDMYLIHDEKTFFNELSSQRTENIYDDM
jgi:hypothetical protein